MTTYRRPDIGLRTFRDAEGEVIEYGNRWRDGPPDDSYEVVENPERFAPLHTVAITMIDYLVSNYEVTIDEGYHVTAGIEHVPKPEDVARAVRLTPLADGCAPIVCVLTKFPGIRFYAGVLFDAAYPSCGCNACDETWVEAAAEFEWQTLAIVGGGLTEEVSEPRRPKWSIDWEHGFTRGMGQAIGFKLLALDGSGEVSGASSAENVPVAALEHARQTLDELAKVSPNGNWLRWPLR